MDREAWRQLVRDRVSDLLPFLSNASRPQVTQSFLAQSLEAFRTVFSDFFASPEGAEWASLPLDFTDGHSVAINDTFLNLAACTRSCTALLQAQQSRLAERASVLARAIALANVQWKYSNAVNAVHAPPNGHGPFAREDLFAACLAVDPILNNTWLQERASGSQEISTITSTTPCPTTTSFHLLSVLLLLFDSPTTLSYLGFSSLSNFCHVAPSSNSSAVRTRLDITGGKCVRMPVSYSQTIFSCFLSHFSFVRSPSCRSLEQNIPGPHLTRVQP